MLGERFTGPPFQIAVDGTAASGKSTVARLLAERLGVSYLDTGKLYRAVALYLMKTTAAAPGDWSAQTVTPLLDGMELSLEPAAGSECRVLLTGEDVTEDLSAPEIERATPFAARISSVRDHLLEPQQRLARSVSVVLAGRDIGTVVLPDAELKLYLEANLRERAKRRLLQRSQQASPEELQHECDALAERDRRDAERDCAPMKAADDAVLIDSSSLGVEAIIERVLSLLEERFRRRSGSASQIGTQAEQVGSEESLSQEPNRAGA